MISLILIFSILILSLLSLTWLIKIEKNNICQSYDYEKQHNGDCIDNNYNEYYMHFNCDWYPFVPCTGHPITKGYVEIKQ